MYEKDGIVDWGQNGPLRIFSWDWLKMTIFDRFLNVNNFLAKNFSKFFHITPLCNIHHSIEHFKIYKMMVVSSMWGIPNSKTKILKMTLCKTTKSVVSDLKELIYFSG